MKILFMCLKKTSNLNEEVNCSDPSLQLTSPVDGLAKASRKSTKNSHGQIWQIGRLAEKWSKFTASLSTRQVVI